MPGPAHLIFATLCLLFPQSPAGFVGRVYILEGKIGGYLAYPEGFR